MRRVAAISVLVLAAGSVAAEAQRPLDRLPDRTVNIVPPALEAVAGRSASELPDAIPVSEAPPVPGTPAAPDAGSDAGSISWHAVAHVVGGALVGGWVGYIGSQVVRSDWDKRTNWDLREERMGWAAVGAVAGVLGSRAVGPTTAPGANLDPLEGRSKRGSVISTAEIRDADVTNAYDVIDLLRRDWLRPRGTNSLSETARGQASTEGVWVRQGVPKIKVYVNDIRIGGPERMREIPADWLISAEFLDSRQATYRYGTGHTHGAIRLSTEVRPE